MTPAEQFNRVERERRQREAELLALLLLLTTGARRYAASAIRHGLSPTEAITRHVMGHAPLDLRGAARPIAKAMLEAHSNAVSRVEKLVNVELKFSPAAEQQFVRYYANAAQEYAATINRQLVKAVAEAQRIGIAEGHNVVEQVRDLRDAFDAAGMSPDHPHRLDGIATKAVLEADGGGTAAAIEEPEAKEQITALTHYSVIDPGTTKICRARKGITLPPDAEYWTRNYPMLHEGCRSAVLPRIGAVKFKEPPEILPAPTPGFGVAPWVTGLTRGPLAA